MQIFMGVFKEIQSNSFDICQMSWDANCVKWNRCTSSNIFLLTT